MMPADEMATPSVTRHRRRAGERSGLRPPATWCAGSSSGRRDDGRRPRRTGRASQFLVDRSPQAIDPEIVVLVDAGAVELEPRRAGLVDDGVVGGRVSNVD